MKTLSHEQALAVLRVLTGLLVLPHGVRKLLGGPVTMLGKSMVKAGFPDWFAWVVTAGELCGAALALGLLTRLAGAAVALTMAGILVFVNLANLTQIGTGKGPVPSCRCSSGLAPQSSRSCHPDATRSTHA